MARVVTRPALAIKRENPSLDWPYLAEYSPRMRIPLSILAALALAFTLAGCSKRPQGPVVLAASSLQGAIEEVADAWAEQGHPRPVLSFAASSALARQVESGAPADIFVSADEEWMDTLAEDGFVQGERRDLLGNRLVLVAPPASTIAVDLDDPTGLLRALPPGSRIAMGDPEAVPAGKYGRAAFESLGLWPALKDRIAPAENVRAALALVEAGEAPLGVVYETDALASAKVKVVAVIPPESHPKIVYPAALLAKTPSDETKALYDFLAGNEAREIFARHGFRRP
jgi:molybdate transport system substrate-binding protein